MCGIAGRYQQADGQKLVDVMSARIAHRGPDAAGVWSYENDRVSVQFGHRRLSIIDLSAAADQPLSKQGMTLGEIVAHRLSRRPSNPGQDDVSRPSPVQTSNGYPFVGRERVIERVCGQSARAA